MTESEKSNTNSERLVLALNDELITIGIPPRPTVLQSIEREMRQDEPDYSVLEKVISLDVGVSASLLKIAKSPLFGSATANVTTVKMALQILGLKTVATAIAGLALRKAFANVANLERFWDASACVAQISSWLANQVPFSEKKIRPEEVYTFGLFRDAGIPVLLANYTDYLDILKAANAEADQPFTAIEDEELGVNHAFIGSRLAQDWELPREFRSAIEFHHNRDMIEGTDGTGIPKASRYLIAISQMAESFHQQATQQSQTLEWVKLGSACLGVLGLTQEDAEALFEQMVTEGVHLRPEF